MSSVDKLTKLAERFARKLSIGQAVTGEDPKSVLADAFFGSPSGPDSIGSIEAFQRAIKRDNSNLKKAMNAVWSSVQKGFDIQIGASVNAAAKDAHFLVATTPALPVAAIAALTNACVADFKSISRNGEDPKAYFTRRLAAGNVRPPDVNISIPDLGFGMGIG